MDRRAFWQSVTVCLVNTVFAVAICLGWRLKIRLKIRCQNRCTCVCTDLLEVKSQLTSKSGCK